MKGWEGSGDRYGDHPNFAGLEPINEPRADSISFEDLSKYYLDCYRMLRRVSPEAYFIIESRIFSTEKEWDNFMTGEEPRSLGGMILGPISAT